MSRIQDSKNRITTDGGSIDFDYYGKRARQLRADAFSGLFRTFRPRIPGLAKISKSGAGPGPRGLFSAARSRART